MLGVVGVAIAYLTHFTGPTTTLLAATVAGGLTPLALPQPASRRRGPRAPAVVAHPQHRRVQLVLVGVAGGLALICGMAAAAEVRLSQAIDAVADASPAQANSSFRTAITLRPWAAYDIRRMALHAYAVATRNGHAAAARPGLPWADELGGSLDVSADGLFDASSVAEGAEDLAGAAARLARAQALDPTNPRIRMAEGIVAAQAHDYAAAERHLLAATDIVPASPDPWRNLAQLYTLMGNPVRARQATDRAAALESGSGP